MTCNGTLKDIEEKNIELKEGLKLLIWMDDEDRNGNVDNLIVEATVKYSHSEKCWVAQFNWDDLKHESEIN